jgi:peptidoglycan/LPS O-acetylase OafA/YrhL
MTHMGDGSSACASLGPAVKGAPEFGKRFECIDGLRGLAALAVVVGHVTHLEPLGAAAVIVFFVISGYCVTAAADAGLKAGVGMRTYMWRRIRRIYPPYLLSIAFFVCTRLARDWLAPTGNASPFDPDGTDLILNATLTQWLWLIAHPAGWPHENPSLFVSVY